MVAHNLVLRMTVRQTLLTAVKPQQIDSNVNRSAGMLGLRSLWHRATQANAIFRDMTEFNAGCIGRGATSRACRATSGTSHARARGPHLVALAASLASVWRLPSVRPQNVVQMTFYSCICHLLAGYQKWSAPPCAHGLLGCSAHLQMLPSRRTAPRLPSQVQCRHRNRYGTRKARH